MSRGVGCRRGSDLALLWFWRRPAAVAVIRSLAWEPPYATSAALEKTKKKKKKKRIVKLAFTLAHSKVCFLNNFSVLLRRIHEPAGSQSAFSHPHHFLRDLPPPRWGPPERECWPGHM